MKICIFGTGAVGGTIGGMLADAGHEMSFIARGKHLASLQEWGLRFITPEKQQTITGHFTQHIPNVATPDLLFLCVKSYSLPVIEESVNRLTGPQTIVVPVVNGIPWWFFMGFDHPKLLDFVPT